MLCVLLCQIDCCVHVQVKLTAIKLGPGGNFPVAPAVYDEGHGTILDSGTTYLCVPTPVRMVSGKKEKAIV